MDLASAFLPEDRRHALAQGRDLPGRAEGSLLFADISGFTPLTEALAQRFGPQRGAEFLTRELNRVYTALIDEVERWGGSVIGFSGDAITCWFPSVEDRPAAACATGCAFAMHRAMAPFADFEVTAGARAALAVKVALASGAVVRLVVGDPAVQLIDVVAGAALDRMAGVEAVTQRGEVLADAATLAALAGTAWAEDFAVVEWRTTPVDEPAAALAPQGDGCTPPAHRVVPDLDAATVRPWLLPPVYARLSADQRRFLAELRPAAALFLHFRGLDFEHDPAAGARLDSFVRWVQHVLARYEGTLIQLTTGDKGSYLYAAFGAPVAHDDDPARAVAAAMDLRTPPDALGVRDVRIGVSQGVMRVGTYGSATRLTYGVLGDATNLAARLMMQAEPGQIVTSEGAAGQVAEHYALESLGPRMLKGKTEPQMLYAVAGVQRRSLRQLSMLYPVPPVGRDAEVTHFDALLAEVQAGAAYTLRLEGEPGAGKSHLAAYLAGRAEAHGFTVHFGASQSVQQAAYAALRSPVLGWLGLDEPPSGDVAAQLEAALIAVEPAWRVRLPLLGDLLGLPLPDNSTTAAFEPRLRREALANLVVDLALRAASHHPLLLLLEDIHWADEATQGILLALARAQRAVPLLLLLVHRPATEGAAGFLAELAALPRQSCLRLGELDAASTRSLLEAQLHGPVDGLAAEFIYAQTQGNPFFSEELSDALAERGQLVQDGTSWTLSARLLQTLQEAKCLERRADGWHLSPDAALGALNLGLPDSVHGLVLARFDRLPEDAKLTLKVASVIGREFSASLLAAAHPAAHGAEVLATQIELLLQRDFARVQASLPVPVYLFKHSITQEAVYQTLLELQRQELHLAVAHGLEQESPEAIEALAHHYWRCDLALPAVRSRAEQYNDAAAWRAKRGYANETALAYFDRLLQLEVRPSWLLGRSEVLHILGRRMQEEASLLALESYAPPDAALQLEIAVLWSEYYAVLGDYPQAEAWLARARAGAEARSDWRNVARCLTRTGLIAWRQGDYPAAMDAYNRALAIVAQNPVLEDIESEARYGLGLVYRQHGRFDEAKQMFAADLEANRQRGNRLREAAALNALGAVANLERDYARAVTLFRAALDLRESIGDRAGVGISVMSLAQVYANMGDYGQVEPLLRQALAIHQSVRNRWDEMLVLNELGILYATVGQYTRAYQAFEQGLQHSSDLASDIGAAYLLCNYGQAQRDGCLYDQALVTLERGLGLARAQEDMHLQAIYLSDMALTYLSTGVFIRAIEDARQALDLFLRLEQPLSTPVVHATLSAAQLGLGNTRFAEAAAHQAIAILDECGGEGPDFPQRDYWMAANVLEALGAPEAAQSARNRAQALLLARAERISDMAMRRTFLENVPVHVAIMRWATTR